MEKERVLSKLKEMKTHIQFISDIIEKEETSDVSDILMGLGVGLESQCRELSKEFSGS